AEGDVDVVTGPEIPPGPDCTQITPAPAPCGAADRPGVPEAWQCASPPALQGSSPRCGPSDTTPGLYCCSPCFPTVRAIGESCGACGQTCEDGSRCFEFRCDAN